ncbi:hypothetical protein O3M35_006560 [Rhynocoris fuscipes]|uniref:Uncharacterized protein n=1 Tax=Rhynocoris fuscipes TaxID=488301 RepID=A0AAW1DDY8_9HEMI
MFHKSVFVFLFILSYHMYNTETSSTVKLDEPKIVHVNDRISTSVITKNLSTSVNNTSSNHKTMATVPIEGGGGSQIISEDKIIIENKDKSSTERPKIIPRKGAILNESETSTLHSSSRVSPRKGVTFNESEINHKTTNTTISSNHLNTTILTTKPTKVNLTASINNNSSVIQKLNIPHKKKPLFTMVSGDRVSTESESFIESSTTGRDYVLPIVLIILALPVLLFIIRLIYKRGTEFTERQQYHRMYLIDGMYNTR